MSDKLIVQNDSFLSISPVFIPHTIVNASLIDCLVQKESGGNEKAVGDSGKAYGALQFWESTFNQYKKKYGMEWLEYTSTQDQKILADKMISDGYGYKWTTYPKCK